MDQEPNHYELTAGQQRRHVVTHLAIGLGLIALVALVATALFSRRRLRHFGLLPLIAVGAIALLLNRLVSAGKHPGSPRP